MHSTVPSNGGLGVALLVAAGSASGFQTMFSSPPILLGTSFGALNALIFGTETYANTYHLR